MNMQDFMMALAGFFVVIDPIGTSAIFLVLSKGHSELQRRVMAIKATVVAFTILMVFGFAGAWVLESFGISMAAFKTAGGVLLLYTGFNMVFNSEENDLSDAEGQEAKKSGDISVFPMATPLLAGAGSMSLMILYMGDAVSPMHQLSIVLAMTAVVLTAGIFMLLGGGLIKVLGVTALNVIARVLGVILCALSVQFIFDGIRESGITTILN